MNENQELVKSIIEGIQEKKGKKISVVDLSGIEDTICKYLVICQGNSPSQVGAITDSVKEHVRKNIGYKPSATDGTQNCIWVALDYIDVIVHIFVPDARSFYDIENLWKDAEIEEIPDID